MVFIQVAQFTFTLCRLFRIIDKKLNNRILSFTQIFNYVILSGLLFIHSVYFVYTLCLFIKKSKTEFKHLLSHLVFVES